MVWLQQVEELGTIQSARMVQFLMKHSRSSLKGVSVTCYNAPREVRSRCVEVRRRPQQATSSLTVALQQISGRVDRAPATETVDRIKPKIIKIGIHSFQAKHSAIKGDRVNPQRMQ